MSLDSFFGELDKEGLQEKAIGDESRSLLSGVDSKLIREREREYKDVEKHWVRKKAWLKIAKELSEEKQKIRGNNSGLRYLTLPAYYRLDVSLFLQEDLIEVTKRGQNGESEEVYVAAFETDPTKFGRMVEQVPRFKLFGSTPIEDALTDPNNGYYHELRELFPFDIINLDLTTSLTPKHEGPYSRVMEAIDCVFDLQSGHGLPWALFLTFRNVPSDWEKNALTQLFDNLQENLDNNPAIHEAFHKVYRVSNVKELAEQDKTNCISQSVSKWLVDRAHSHRFKLNQMHCYHYSRYNEGIDPYPIYKQVYIFSTGEMANFKIPTKGIPPQSWMMNDLKNCINRHKCHDVEEKLYISLEQTPNKYKEMEDEINSLVRLMD